MHRNSEEEISRFQVYISCFLDVLKKIKED